VTVKVCTTTESEPVHRQIETTVPTLTMVLKDGSCIEFDHETISQLHEMTHKLLEEHVRIEAGIEDHARDVNEWLNKNARGAAS